MSQKHHRAKRSKRLRPPRKRREAGLLLRVWAETDDELRQGLVAPFLNNLCALAVQRAVRAPEPGGATGRRLERSTQQDNAASILSGRLSYGDDDQRTARRRAAAARRKWSAQTGRPHCGGIPETHAVSGYRLKLSYP